MKLQSMLLPTGEFALIASELPDDQFDDEEFTSEFMVFREKAGAAAGWVTNLDVEVEGALIDEDARRAAPEPRYVTTEGTNAHDDVEKASQIWKDLGATTDQSSYRELYFPRTSIGEVKFSLDGDSIGTEFMALAMGIDPTKDYSPAGLVVEDHVRTGTAGGELGPELQGADRPPAEVDQDDVVAGDVVAETPGWDSEPAPSHHSVVHDELEPDYAADTKLVELVAGALYGGYQFFLKIGESTTIREAYRERARAALRAGRAKMDVQDSDGVE